MSLVIIDGYNLLHASGILARGIGPGSLERLRGALLNFLAESLDEPQLARTTVVFDAQEAPPGLPRLTKHRGITVRFAPRGSDADAEIERLIAEHHAPRRLTVVSSDHRLHRAARRRRARPIDSDKWYVEVVRERLARGRAKDSPGKPSPPATEGEVRFWLRQFGFADPEPGPGDDAQSNPQSPFPPATPRTSATTTRSLARSQRRRRLTPKVCPNRRATLTSIRGPKHGDGVLPPKCAPTPEQNSHYPSNV